MYLLKDLHPDSKTTENFLTSYFCRQSAGITNQINGENELMLDSDIPCMQTKDRAPEKNHFTNYHKNFRLELPVCPSPACKSVSIPLAWYLHDTRPRPSSSRSRGHIATHQHTHRAMELSRGVHVMWHAG